MNSLPVLSFLTRITRKRYRRWNRRMTLSKRQQFVAITAILTTGLVLTQLATPELRYPMVAIISLVAYALTAFGLRDDLGGVEWLTLLILPMFFTAATALFYFLLPVRWLTRVPVAALYFVSMYALLLTENIYNVAADRTIALLRAAHTIGFLLTLVTYFLLLQTILAFRFNALVNSLLTGIVSFLLIFQTLWAIELEEQASRRLFQISVALTFMLIELMWAFSFWPVKSTLHALFLTTCFYGSVGMAQQYFVEKLYKKTVMEFFSVVAIVFIIVLFATQWRGNY